MSGSNQTAGMRVAHVVRQFHPAIGGLEDVVLNLARTQRTDFGIDARVVTLDRLFTDPRNRLACAEVVCGVPVIRIPWCGSTRYPLAPGVLRRLGQADILHIHGIDFFFDFLAFTKPLHRRRLVASTHGGFFHTEHRQRLKRLWFATATRASMLAYDAIVAVSAQDASLFAPLTSRQIVTIENGVNINKYDVRPGVTRDPRRIISFGRFARHKRLDRVMALLAALRKRDQGWTLVLAGGPGDQTQGELHAAAQATGVSDHVRILCAPDDATLGAEMAQASWFCSASAYEGFGIAAVEAAAAGLTLVLSDIPPFERLRARLRFSVAFEPAVPDIAAQEMIAMAAAAACRGEAAPSDHPEHSAVSAFGWPAAAAAYCRVYQAVMAPAISALDARPLSA